MPTSVKSPVGITSFISWLIPHNGYTVYMRYLESNFRIKPKQFDQRTMKPYFRLIAGTSRICRRTRAIILFVHMNYMLTILLRGKWLSLVFRVIKGYRPRFFMVSLRTLTCLFLATKRFVNQIIACNSMYLRRSSHFLKYKER